MDYDEELMELHENSNRQLPDSDEDTEDASEDGESRHEEVTEIKEQWVDLFMLSRGIFEMYLNILAFFQGLFWQVSATEGTVAAARWG